MSSIPPRKAHPPASSLVNGSGMSEKIRSNPRPASNTPRKRLPCDCWCTMSIVVYLPKIRERPTNTANTPKILMASTGLRAYWYTGRRRMAAPTITSSRPAISHNPFFWCVDRPHCRLTKPLLNQYIAKKFTKKT